MNPARLSPRWRRLALFMVALPFASCSTKDQTGPTPPPPPPAAAAHLTFVSLSHSVAVGDTFPTFVVEVRDSAGALVSAASDTVTIVIGTNPNHGTLHGTATVVAASGTATFHGLSIDSTGTGYRLVASAPHRMPTTSDPIEITSSASPPPLGAHWNETPQAIGVSTSYRALSRDDGEEHCAIPTNGPTECWGHLAGPGTDQHSPTPLPAIIDAATSFLFACGLSGNGGAACWGENDDGELGNGTTTRSTDAVAVSGNRLYGEIATGQVSACALDIAGQAWCWGRNPAQASGYGSRPVAVGTGLPFHALAAGFYHYCALTSDGSAYCWGAPGDGTLGLGTDPATGIARGSAEPAPVLGGHKFTVLAAGGYTTCGLESDGSTWCWGTNYVGQVNGVPDPNGGVIGAPVRVANVPAFRAIGTGGDTYKGWTCGLTSAGVAWCWGATHDPNAGHASGTGPAPVSSPATFGALSVGMSSACAIDSGGHVWCWGANDKGQLGR